VPDPEPESRRRRRSSVLSALVRSELGARLASLSFLFRSELGARINLGSDDPRNRCWTPFFFLDFLVVSFLETPK